MSRYGVCILCLVLLPLLAFAEEPDKPLVTVMDFSLSSISDAEGRLLVDFISNSVKETNRYRVIDRGQRDSILREQEFSLSGCTDEACQLEVGKLLSANLMFVGSIGRIGDRFILNMKLIDVATGETIGTASEKYGDINSLVDDSDRLVIGILGTPPKGEELSGVEGAGSIPVQTRDAPPVPETAFIRYNPGGFFKPEFYTFLGENYPVRYFSGFSHLVETILFATPAINDDFQLMLNKYLTAVKWNRTWQITGIGIGVLGSVILFAGASEGEDGVASLGVFGFLAGVALNMVGSLRMVRLPKDIVNHYNLHYAGR